jgi:hypothetical protein
MSLTGNVCLRSNFKAKETLYHKYLLLKYCMQAANKIPDDAWEYQIRKALNDAAYNGLDYVPYCSTMPVQESCDEPKFMWRKKGSGSGK